MKNYPFLSRFIPGVMALAVLVAPAFAAEVFELGEANFAERPLGKEADGIVGDFVMRNDKVELLSSGNLPLRRANMSTFYGEDGITPGCLYDLTLLDADNDQITIFSPSGQRGPVNYVRIAADGKDGEAIVETVISSAKASHCFWTCEMRLMRSACAPLSLTSSPTVSRLLPIRCADSR